MERVSKVVDPVVEVYKRDVDRTLLLRNLSLTPTERIEQLQQFVAFAGELRAAKVAAIGHAAPSR